MNTAIKEPRSKKQEPNKIQFLNPKFEFRSANIQHPASSFVLAVTTSNIQHPASSFVLEVTTSNIQHPTSCFAALAMTNITPLLTTAPGSQLLPFASPPLADRNDVSLCPQRFHGVRNSRLNGLKTYGEQGN